MGIKQWIITCVLIFGLATDISAQGRVFYEPGDGSSQATTDCRVTTTSRDGVAHRNGSALECGWDGTLDWTNPLKTRELELTVPVKAELLADAWFRVDANVDARAGSKLMRLSFGGGKADVIVACQFEQAEPTLFMSVNGQYSFWGNTAASRCRTGWNRIKVYVSTSLIRLWLNGALLREWTGVFVIDGMVGFMSNWSSNDGWTHDALNHVYWDEQQIFSDAGTGGSGSMRDGTMTQGGVIPSPTNCVPGTPRLLQEIKDPQCVNGARTVLQEWTRDGDIPATNGGSACSPIPYTITTSEPCVVEPPPTFTVITAVKTCRVTVQDAPPDQLGGWGVQFRWDTNNFGSRDTSSPFERARDFPAGSYQLGAIWTKTGQTPVYRPTVLYECK